MILQIFFFFSPQINWNPNAAPKDRASVKPNQNSGEWREMKVGGNVNANTNM